MHPESHDARRVVADGDKRLNGDVARGTGAVRLANAWIIAVLSGRARRDGRADSNGNGDNASFWQQKWSGIRMVDTVVLDGAGSVEDWVFTTKSGHVNSKKRAQKRASIAERFERFALANPNNEEKHVALVGSRVDGPLVALDRRAFRDAITGSQVSPDLLGATLHCYVRPHQGINAFLRAHYVGHDASVSVVWMSPLYHTSKGAETSSPSTAGACREPVNVGRPDCGTGHEAESKRVIADLVKFMGQRLPRDAGQEISECETDFVVDDNGQLWLTSVPRVKVTTTSASTDNTLFPPTSVTPAEQEGNADTDAPRVPALPTTGEAAPVEGSGAPLGSARQRLSPKASESNEASSSTPHHTSRAEEKLGTPELRGLPEIRALGVRGASGGHDDCGEAGAVPIMEKRGGVYVATVHASALRGLCSWRKSQGRRGSDYRDQDSPRWQFIESRYKGNLAGERRPNRTETSHDALSTISPRTAFEELARDRFKIRTRSLLLAMSAAAFLRGNVPLHGGDTDTGAHGGGGYSLAKRWRDYDNQAQFSLASANPQEYYGEATACGNCVEICRQLDSIREQGFPDGQGGTPTPPHAHPSPAPARPSSEPLPVCDSSMPVTKRPGTTAAGAIIAATAECGAGRVKPHIAHGDAQEILESTSRCPAGDSASDLPAQDSSSFPALPDKGDDHDRASKGHAPAAVSATFDRVVEAYCNGSKPGRGSKYEAPADTLSKNRRAKIRSTRDSASRGGKEQLPNVAALARFAIERERLARDMGVDELGGPATLGVVNVGGHVRNRKAAANAGKSKRSRAPKERAADDNEGGNDNAYAAHASATETVWEDKSRGEVLLEELERVAEARSMESAARRASSAHYSSEASYSEDRAKVARGLAPLTGELSTSESAFLERSRYADADGYLPGRRGDSLFGDHFDAAFRGENSLSSGGAAAGGSGHVATISALRDRLATVETDNAALRTRARKAEEDKAAEAAKAVRATKKLAQARMEFSRAMSEKDDDFRRKELALDERHCRDLAQKLQVSAEGAVEGSPGENAAGGKNGRVAPGGAAQPPNKGLVIVRLEQALKDMAEQQRRFAHAKRAMLAEKSQEVASAEAKGRVELQEARSLAAVMEDRASAFQEQVAEAAKQISTYKAREDDQIRRRKAAEAEADNIRRDISVLRQSVHASQSLDIPDASGGRRDGQSALAAITATSEAQIRTLNNKVEFLKAQLSSEQTLKAEVEAALASSQKALFNAKDEARKRAAAAEKSREEAVEEASSRVQRQVEESMDETYRVQSKVQALQDQLNDTLEDLSMARRREEALKTEVAQTNAKLEDRGSELAKAQSRADDLAEAHATEKGSSADRAAREALVRRLDNERQYLKSQLQSEITCKDELREALAAATRQLGDVKTDWASEQAARTEDFRRELQSKSGAIGDLNAEKIALEVELVAATRQVGLLKEGYSKARDNLRAEQSALETARTANRRLKEEVQASTEELTAIRQQQREDALRHSQSLVAAKTALDEAEEAKRKQRVDLQLQLREQLLKTGGVQRELMNVQAELEERDLRSEQKLAAERLGQGLARWSRNRTAWAYYRMLNAATIIGAEDDVRERTRQALIEAGEAARKAQEMAVEDTKTAAGIKAEEELAAAGSAFAEERAALLENAEAVATVTATQSQTIEELKTLECNLRRELEKNRADTMMRDKKHQEDMARAAQQADERAREKVHDAVAVTEKACAEAGQRAAEDADEKWRKVLREHLNKAAQDAATVAAAASREHDAVLKETQQAFQEERDRLSEQAQLLAERASSEERARGLEREADARARGVAEAEAAAALTRADDARLAHTEREAVLAAAAERAEAAAEAARLSQEDMRRRVEKEALLQREKLEQELAKARDRAVKLEGGKWQRASEEAEARAAAEQVGASDKAAAYERGVTDRGRRADAEATQLHDAAEKALEEVKQGARTTIEEMATRHSDELEAEKRRVIEEEAVVRENALGEAREKWADQQAKAVVNARAAASSEVRVRAERERASAVEAAREREKLATERVRDEYRSAKTEWVGERRQMKEETVRLREAVQKAKDEVVQALAHSNQATQRARDRWEHGQKVAMEEAATKAVDEREKALEDARKAFNREKKRALDESQNAFNAQAEAIADRLRKQASASVQEAVSAHEETRKERDNLLAELESCRNELQETKAIVGRVREDCKEQAVSHSIRTWRLAAATMRYRLGHEQLIQQMQAEGKQREVEAEQNWEASRQALSTSLEELLEIAFDSRKRFAKMEETLVNHKREVRRFQETTDRIKHAVALESLRVLIDHKVQSASLHKELDSLAREREQVEDQRVLLHREYKEVEGQVKDAEKEAHSHSRQSTIGPDGTIIAARARKKKRLDEELESLLEALEAKRKALGSVDRKLADLADTRSVKDDEMKKLERTLVQVLVEQQKRLLALLGEAGEEAERLDEIDQKTRYARDEARRRKALAKTEQRDFT